jgi:hypothetical protein
MKNEYGNYMMQQLFSVCIFIPHHSRGTGIGVVQNTIKSLKTCINWAVIKTECVLFSTWWRDSSKYVKQLKKTKTNSQTYKESFLNDRLINKRMFWQVKIIFKRIFAIVVFLDIGIWLDIGIYFEIVIFLSIIEWWEQL